MVNINYTETTKKYEWLPPRCMETLNDITGHETLVWLKRNLRIKILYPSLK